MRLSQLSHGAGCACKLGSGELTHVLRHLVPFPDPNVLVDAAFADDAAVYRIDADRAIVATTDFFTPIVDDAFDFGRFAATNAISDIYAMGARPLFALNLVAFPRKLLSEGVLEEIIRGGGEVARRAGIAVVGGHSIDDAEPKYGMCVIGEVHPERIVRNSGAQLGDILVLTKAIGTGIITTAIKRDAADEESVRAAIDSMTTLNRKAAEAMLRHGVHAATDVTGFGLLGHLREIARASRMAARVHASDVPLLPGARDLVMREFVPGGTRRNFDDVASSVEWTSGVSEEMTLLLCDAQTSGGLLIAVASDRADQLLEDLRAGDTPRAAIIGTIENGEAGRIVVES
jgi:selenide,water dikinase